MHWFDIAALSLYLFVFVFTNVALALRVYYGDHGVGVIWNVCSKFSYRALWWYTPLAVFASSVWIHGDPWWYTILIAALAFVLNNILMHIVTWLILTPDRRRWERSLKAIEREGAETPNMGKDSPSCEQDGQPFIRATFRRRK